MVAAHSVMRSPMWQRLPGAVCFTTFVVFAAAPVDEPFGERLGKAAAGSKGDCGMAGGSTLGDSIAGALPGATRHPGLACWRKYTWTSALVRRRSAPSSRCFRRWTTTTAGWWHPAWAVVNPRAVCPVSLTIQHSVGRLQQHLAHRRTPCLAGLPARQPAVGQYGRRPAAALPRPCHQLVGWLGGVRAPRRVAQRVAALSPAAAAAEGALAATAASAWRRHR